MCSKVTSPCHYPTIYHKESIGKNIAVSYDTNDAPIIAAAPDLLEVAQSFEDVYRLWKSHFPNDITLDKYLYDARAAISKATES